MNGRLLFRIVLPAVVALPLGFIGLALAAENEPTIPAPLLMLLSPGLKLAELIAPGQHGSLGATFGWFLRVGIAANAAYYFVIFFLLAYNETNPRFARWVALKRGPYNSSTIVGDGGPARVSRALPGLGCRWRG